MKKWILPVAGIALLMPLLTGCRSEGDSIANSPRADQEKAFQGDPSKVPAGVKQMMRNPPTNAQPAPPGPRTTTP